MGGRGSKKGSRGGRVEVDFIFSDDEKVLS
jgi:hypothetical protein